MHFSILEYFGQRSITALIFGDDVSFIFIFFSLSYIHVLFLFSLLSLIFTLVNGSVPSSFL